MSELGKLVKQLAISGVQSTSPSDLMLGEVVSMYPNLQIKIRNDSNLILPKELLVVDRTLLSYDETIMIDGESKSIHHYDKLETGVVVVLESFSGGEMFYVSAVARTFE